MIRTAQLVTRRLANAALPSVSTSSRGIAENLPPPPQAPPLPTEPCPVNSYNEWDPLEEVILGRAEGARIPNLTKEVKAIVRSGFWEWISENAGKPYDPVIVENAIKEADELQRVLELEGVTVRRPEPVDYAALGDFKTPNFEEGGFINSCPRDSILVVGNEIIQSTMSWRSRMHEGFPYYKVLNDYFKRGAKWTQAPRPAMGDDLYRQDYPFEDEEKRLEMAYKGDYILTDVEACFDAADVMRCGTDIFMQISQTTNWGGYRWLQRHLGPEFRVHYLNFQDTSPFHIDATLVPLKPGLIMTNPTRLCLQTEFFRKNGWEVVVPPFPTEVDQSMVYASAWLSINTLALDEERIIVYKHEQPLIDFFKKHGLKPIGVDFSHAFNLGGGFHCWTSDIRRRGTKQSFFDKFDGTTGISN